MARRRIRRHRAGRTIGGFLRSMPEGIIQLMLASMILALLAAVAGPVSNYLSFNLTVGNNSVSVNLGFIVNVIIAFSGIFLFLSGLRKLAKIRI